LGEKTSQLTGTNLVDLLHIGSDTHLLSELRRLSEESDGCDFGRSGQLRRFRKTRAERGIKLTLEVGNTENGSSRLGSSTLKFGRVDLDEALSVEVFSEEVSDTRLNLEDGLVGDRLRIVNDQLSER